MMMDCEIINVVWDLVGKRMSTFCCSLSIIVLLPTKSQTIEKCIYVLFFFYIYFFWWYKRLEVNCLGVYFLDEISAAVLGFKKLSISELVFFFFISSPIVWWCLLPIFPSTCNFPFFQVFWYLTVIFLPLFLLSNFSLWAWHIFQLAQSARAAEYTVCISVEG